MTAPQPPAADDLAEWLNAIDEESMYERPATTKATIDRAAARITELEARVKVLEEALRPFARLAAQYDPPEGDDSLPLMRHDGDDLNIGHLRAARAALGDRHD